MESFLHGEERTKLLVEFLGHECKNRSRKWPVYSSLDDYSGIVASFPLSDKQCKIGAVQIKYIIADPEKHLDTLAL